LLTRALQGLNILSIYCRSILHGYFNPLVFWYYWEYLLTSKEIIFLQGIEDWQCLGSTTILVVKTPIDPHIHHWVQLKPNMIPSLDRSCWRYPQVVELQTRLELRFSTSSGGTDGFDALGGFPRKP
jgi:hypothetical protein